jgi:hypothetical protein
VSEGCEQLPGIASHGRDTRHQIRNASPWSSSQGELGSSHCCHKEPTVVMREGGESLRVCHLILMSSAIDQQQVILFPHCRDILVHNPTGRIAKSMLCLLTSESLGDAREILKTIQFLEKSSNGNF